MQHTFAIVPIKGIASPASKEKPIEGGKWKIVEEFNGRSHEDGGIDIEVMGGMVRRIHAPYDKPDEIAKKGRFWKNLAAGAYGFAEGVVDSATLGYSDKYTDQLYGKIEDKFGGSEQEKRERASVRGYGTVAGVINSPLNLVTGAGWSQLGKGLGAGVSEGSPNSKFAQKVGYAAPKIGAAIDKIRFGVWDDDKAKSLGLEGGGGLRELTEAFMSAPSQQPVVSNLSSASQGGFPEAQMQRSTMPPSSTFSPSSNQELKGELAGAGTTRRQTAQSYMDGYASSGGGGGPIQFQQQPVYAADSMSYLNRYGVNV